MAGGFHFASDLRCAELPRVMASVCHATEAVFFRAYFGSL